MKIHRWGALAAETWGVAFSRLPTPKSSQKARHSDTPALGKPNRKDASTTHFIDIETISVFSRKVSLNQSTSFLNQANREPNR